MNFQDMEPFFEAARAAVREYDGMEDCGLRVLYRSENVTFAVTRKKENEEKGDGGLRGSRFLLCGEAGSGNAGLRSGEAGKRFSPGGGSGGGEDEPGSPIAVLRVSRPGYHTVEEIGAELRWLEELNEGSSLQEALLSPGTDRSGEEQPRRAGISCRDAGEELPPDREMLPNRKEDRDPQKTGTAQGAYGESREFAVARPLRNRHGGRLTMARAGGRDFPCVMFAYVEGTHPEDTADFRQIGWIAAVLHRQVMNWEESGALRRPHWDLEAMTGRNGLFGDWRACGELDASARDLLETVCGAIGRRLENYGRTRENYGLIHADLRSANLLCGSGGRLCVLDFDDCGYGWFLYDLAASFSFIEHDPRLPQWVRAWLEGYESLRPLTTRDRREIPAFFMARRIQLLAWVFSHGDSDPAAGYRQDFAAHTVEMARTFLKNYA